MKKKHVILIIIIVFSFQIFSQKQGNIWYFANYAGLDFTNGVPVPLSNGQVCDSTLSCSEGCSSICDFAGNLLFYATPTKIWNRNHNLMPNGTGLSGGLSSTQGVIIIPQPESNELFYVFTLDEFQNNFANGLRYSMVDICLDNGMGDVIINSKNILLLDSTGEKMAATNHSNGTDIWLVTRKHFTNEFYSFLITSSGISSPVISAIGWANPQQAIPNALGQMKISPNGSKIAFGVGNQTPKIVQLFDFDNSTGIISNVIDLPTSTNSGNPYGIAFSPDNTKLYIRGPTPTGLNQFDLSSGIPDTIINSLYHVPWSGSYAGTGLQLANNGKIYVCQPPYIGVINFPNLAGNACDFVGNAITSNSSYTFPSFIDNFNYKNGIPICDVGINEPKSENLISIYPNPSQGIFTLGFTVENPQDVNIQVINNIGQVVYKKQHKNYKGVYSGKIDLSTYANGAYILNITVGENIHTENITVLR